MIGGVTSRSLSQTAAIKASKKALQREMGVYKFLQKRHLEGARMRCDATQLRPFFLPLSFGSCAALRLARRKRLVLRGSSSRTGTDSRNERFPTPSGAGIMMNVLCRTHETFCAVLAPPTETVLRWQRTYFIITVLIGMLCVDIWRAALRFFLFLIPPRAGSCYACRSRLLRALPVLPSFLERGIKEEPEAAGRTALPAFSPFPPRRFYQNRSYQVCAG